MNTRKEDAETMKKAESENTESAKDEEWLKQRWAPWSPEGERQECRDDLKAELGQSREKQVPAEAQEQENLCRPSLKALEEALAEESERMRAAYRKAGL